MKWIHTRLFEKWLDCCFWHGGKVDVLNEQFIIEAMTGDRTDPTCICEATEQNTKHIVDDYQRY